MPISSWPPMERPREKLLASGASSLSDVAREIEQSLNSNNLAQAIEASQLLDSQVAGSKAKLTDWLQSR